MKVQLAYVVVFLSLPYSASTVQKYITINICGKDDLSITCSIINSDQLSGLHIIQLKRENDAKFDDVISISNVLSQIKWKDEVLKNRATANGSIEEAELRLFIHRVQFFTDFTKYKCNMMGILKSPLMAVTQETDPVTASQINTCTSSTFQKYITINICGKDVLSITCSIINSDQLSGLHIMQLKRENDTKFDDVISMVNGWSRIEWKDKGLKNRATANGSIEEAELRLFIHRVQFFTDFTKYKCIMEGSLETAYIRDTVTEEVAASHIESCTSSSKPLITTTKKPESTPRPGNTASSKPLITTTKKPETTQRPENTDKAKRSSGTTLHIPFKGLKTYQYTGRIDLSERLKESNAIIGHKHVSQ